MAYTYSKIASVTVGSGGVSSIDFLAIPQNYTDLLLVFSTRASVDNSDVNLRINSISSGYSYRQLYGTGSATGSDSNSALTVLTRAGRVNPSTSTSNTFSNTQIYIPNYTSNNSKSFSIDGVTENNATAAVTNLIAGLCATPDAINSINIVNAGGGTITQHSTATLYGIKAEVQ